jgi:hypothetical protein
MNSHAMETKEWNDRADWLTLGINKGWISKQYCAAHGRGYDDQIDEGEDPCELVFRIL